MPRYFFDISDDSDSLNDEGIELANVQTAGIEALHYAGEIIKAKARQLIGEKSWHMSITDERGLLILRLDLSLTDFSHGAFSS